MLAPALAVIAGLQITLVFGLCWYGLGRWLSGRSRAIATSTAGAAYFLGLWTNELQEVGLVMLGDWRVLVVAIGHAVFAVSIARYLFQRAAVHERESHG